MLRYLWDFFVILTALVWILSLVWQGYISPSFGAFALLAIVFFRALARGLGGNIGRLIRFLFRIGLPLASLGTLAVIFGGGEYKDVVAILGGIGLLCVVLAGFYIMFWGLFSRQRK